MKGNRFYDVMKFVALVLLPASNTLYFSVAQLWGLPHVEKVMGTVAAVDTFLGIVLKLSSSAYHNSDAKYDGDAVVVETPEKKTFELNLNSDPADLDQKQEITFRVVKGEVSRVETEGLDAR